MQRRTLLAGGLASGALAALWSATPARAASYTTRADFDAAWTACAPALGGTNEDGFLTWHVSYAMQALLRMYQATLDPAYLDVFVTYADDVVAATDQARGVSDTLGRSGPVWRASGSYTAGVGTLQSTTGAAAIEIRYANATPTSATATVVGVTATTFDLTLSHPVTGTVTLAGVDLDPASPNYVVTAVAAAYTVTRRWTAKDLRPNPASAPALANTVLTLSPTYHNLVVSSGMISYPLAKFARIVSERGLTSYATKAIQYKAAARAAVDFHESEWRTRLLPSGLTGGDYVFVSGAPQAFDGAVMPFNQSHAVGQTLAELYRMDGATADRLKVNAMIYTLRGNGHTGALPYEWHYWPTHSELYTGYAATDGVSEYTPSYRASTQWEDISHAGITIEMFTAAHEAGLAASSYDLAHLCSTYLDKVVADTTHLWCRVNGTMTQTDSYAWQAGRWLSLEPYATSSVAAHVDAVWQAANLVPQYSAHLIGIAYQVWANQSGWTND